ncbi:HD domain-containing protein [Microbacterium sp. A8/3-1]|uniref:HD domain-containing protein n=1 Tax=Microbacterium sp. A8/3-1 TaxID=3160749 RepID=A0AAU7W3H0_9MICO
MAAEMLEPLLVEHSQRVFYFAHLHAQRLGIEPDPELLYIAALFHDTGLAASESAAQRFEVDGADHGQRFLHERGFSAEAEKRVWEAIALHTTPGIPRRMEAETAALHLGVLTDAIGLGLDLLRTDDVDEVVAAHPRGAFKDGFLAAVVRGLRDRPETANGTVNADILTHFLPELVLTSTVDRVLGSRWAS